MHEKIKLFIIISNLFSIVGCESTKLLSDNESRIINYRELESEIRDGETELAVTSERIYSNSAEIERTNNKLEEQLGTIKESVEKSERTEQGIGEIIQQIRSREIPENKLIELGIISKE